MCYYDYIRFQCGCRIWGACRKRCAEDRTRYCGTNRVYKHLYSPRGLYCKTHGTCSKTPTLHKSILPACYYPNTTPLDVIRRHLRDMDDEFVFRFTHSATDRARENSSRPKPIKDDANSSETTSCFLRANHRPPHQFRTKCTNTDCYLHDGHRGGHSDQLGTTPTKLYQTNEQNFEQTEMELQKLNSMILRNMGKREQPERDMIPQFLFGTQERTSIKRDASSFLEPPWWHKRPKVQGRTSLRPLLRKRLAEPPPVSKFDGQGTPYRPLHRKKKEIRLYELLPSYFSTEIKGRFVHVLLDSSPPFTALSYTWGPEEVDELRILVDETSQIPVRQNLWNFLRRQSSIITSPKYFWIDAICINQEVVLERNHQVSMMKMIYTTASCVYIWLGSEAENSNDAMNWLIQKGTKKLRPRGPGYHSIWNRLQGMALVRLCERPYWRRMWIIQEIVHAKKIVMWCGSKRVDWSAVENLYSILKTLQDETWEAHHEYAAGVLHSPAGVMAWQRAHWRYPKLDAPRLQTLIEVFQEWQSKDVRDKVFALVSMANRDTAIEPNYSLTAQEVFHAVQKKNANPDWKFENLLSQLLGLSWRDVSLLHGQQLIAYKTAPPERLLLRRRIFDDDW